MHVAFVNALRVAHFSLHPQSALRQSPPAASGPLPTVCWVLFVGHACSMCSSSLAPWQVLAPSVGSVYIITGGYLDVPQCAFLKPFSVFIIWRTFNWETAKDHLASQHDTHYTSLSVNDDLCLHNSQTKTLCFRPLALALAIITGNYHGCPLRWFGVLLSDTNFLKSASILCPQSSEALRRPLSRESVWNLWGVYLFLTFV